MAVRSHPNTNTTNSTTNQSFCFLIVCQFTKSERIAIIAAYFMIFLLSLVGNAIVCYTIGKSKKLRKSCTSFSILNLSIADICITIFTMPLQTVDMYILGNWVYGSFMCTLVHFLQNTSMVATILILLAISIEKFLVVCFPFQSRVYRDRFRYAIYAMWIVAIVDSSAVVNLKELYNFDDGSFCMFAWPSLSFKRAYLVGHGAFFFFLPLLIMACLHFATIIAIQRKTAHRIGGTSTTVRTSKLKRRRKAVTILVVIVLLFTVSWGPLLGTAMWEAFADKHTVGKHFKLLNQLFVVCMFLIFLTTSLHPVIYCFLGKQYRRAVQHSMSKKKTNTSNTRSSRKDNQLAAVPLKVLNEQT